MVATATKDGLQKQQAELHEKMQGIVELAQAEGRGFSDEERASLKQWKEEYAQLADSIESCQEDEDLTGFVASHAPPSAGRRSQPSKIKVKENFLEDPKRGFRDHREFLLCAMDSAQAGKLDDPRLKSLAAGADEQGGHSDPYGGFLLPVGFQPDLLTVMAESDPTAGRTAQVPMQTQSVEIPARTDKNHTNSVSGGLRVYRRGETDTSSSSRMEMERVKLTATMLFGLAYATEELLARSPISFVALLDAGFNDEFRSVLLNEKLHGTGAGEYEGVVGAAATVSIAKETGQSANTIVFENVLKMRARCWGYGNAIWLANHDTIPQLSLLNQAIGTGGVPVWQPSAREDAPDMLLGRPIFFTEFAETLGTKGDIICGNWTQYLEGTLGPQQPQRAESVHVRFINHERTFKFWLENDGRMWWRSALTPKKSSSTLSPFVVLNSRS